MWVSVALMMLVADGLTVGQACVHSTDMEEWTGVAEHSTLEVTWSLRHVSLPSLVYLYLPTTSVFISITTATKARSQAVARIADRRSTASQQTI